MNGLKTLNRIMVMFAVGLLCFSMSAWADSNARADLQKLLESYKTYQASFQQKTFNAEGAVSTQAKGKVYLKRPGKFRWETHTPNEQTLIANDKILWVYDIDLQQATRRKLTGQDDMIAQLMVGDSGKVLSKYAVSQVKKNDKQIQYQLAPLKQGDNLFQSVTLYFRSNTLVSMDIINNLEEHTEITFSKVQANKPVAARLFIFKPPAGVDILR